MSDPKRNKNSVLADIQTEVWYLTPQEVMRVAAACSFSHVNEGKDLLHKFQSNCPPKHSLPYVSNKSDMQPLKDIVKAQLGETHKLFILLKEWQAASGLQPLSREPADTSKAAKVSREPSDDSTASDMEEQASHDPEQHPLMTAPPELLMEFIENEVKNLSEDNVKKVAAYLGQHLDAPVTTADTLLGVLKQHKPPFNKHTFINDQDGMEPFLNVVTDTLGGAHVMAHLIHLWRAANAKTDRKKTVGALLDSLCPNGLPEQAHTRFVIVCAKPYEFEAMNRAFDSIASIRRHPMSLGYCFGAGYKEAANAFYRFDFVMTKGGKAYHLTVTRFVAKLQGPIECGIHVGQVITALEPDYIGMIGVCGGHHLNDVIVATKAVDARAGRVIIEKSSCGLERIDPSAYGRSDVAEYMNPYFFKPASSDDATAGQDAELAVGDHMAVTFQAPPGITVHMKSTLYTYPQVREDCVALVGETEGLEMEAFPFFKAVRMARAADVCPVKALPVMKAVSDVSELALDKEGRNPAVCEQLKKAKVENDGKFAAVLGEAGAGDLSHGQKRKLFRKIAAGKAATVMAALIDQAPFLK
ncbi:hypothetical protein PTSG_05953 [Salpingoeca rosetta]|uniref:Uncharacterized protein n=1 Tax=Salpingoeca rosetta (strain ATCC 50818 / BSB-021) TaxID=946362 RepID=F2UD93_SALR5|nr:uncharacterized protein PTSG_05953 [Salpingoeca rosetta]EGD74588.1 hypothetical protein PTSG_05953 [Salpingoeca rosetta]|eukprot:XP_004992845.1 hypothetical protein PTSG_05953 [Salpingoeca rosetta]